MKLNYCSEIPQHGELGSFPEIATETKIKIKKHHFDNILSEFIRSERPYAEIIFDENEYASPYSFYHSARRFIDKHRMRNVSVIRRGARIFLKRWYW